VAQVHGHRLAQGDQAEGGALDLGLQGVELLVAGDHGLGQGDVAARQGVEASDTCASARPPSGRRRR
jgi:hypothetical protein